MSSKSGKRPERVRPKDEYRLENIGTVKRINPGGESHRVDLVGALEPHFFDVCPICLCDAPGDLEHVPPDKMGGGILTKTCKDCNNWFGTNVEDELLAWYFDELRFSSFSNEGSGLIGPRKLGDTYLRVTENDEVIIHIVPRGDSGGEESSAILGAADTSLNMQFRDYDARKWKAAALKQAYLAACVCLKEIPGSEIAKAIRKDLVAIRDWRKGTPFPESQIANELPVSRSHEPAKDDLPVFALAQTEDGAPAFVLARGGLLVPWPFGPGEWHLNVTQPVFGRFAEAHHAAVGR